MMNPSMEIREHKHRPTKEQDAEVIFQQMEIDANYPLSPEDQKFLRDYVYLLQRQALKAKNQRKGLRSLNRAHRITVLELRWLTEAAQASMGSRTWEGMLERARKTLWGMFREEQTGASVQITQLANFILDEVQGEPSRSEGAVEAAIRIMKEQQKALDEFGTPDEIRVALNVGSNTIRKLNRFLDAKGLGDEFAEFEELP